MKNPEFKNVKSKVKDLKEILKIDFSDFYYTSICNQWVHFQYLRFWCEEIFSTKDNVGIKFFEGFQNGLYIFKDSHIIRIRKHDYGVVVSCLFQIL